MMLSYFSIISQCPPLSGPIRLILFCSFILFSTFQMPFLESPVNFWNSWIVIEESFLIASLITSSSSFPVFFSLYLHLFDFCVIDDTGIEYKGIFFLWDYKYYTEFFALFLQNMPILLPKVLFLSAFGSTITISSVKPTPSISFLCHKWHGNRIGLGSKKYSPRKMSIIILIEEEYQR